MFLYIQNLGEDNSISNKQALESREFSLMKTTSEEFLQTRQVSTYSD